MFRTRSDKNVVIFVGSTKIEWTVKKGPIKRREKDVRVRGGSEGHARIRTPGTAIRNSCINFR